MSKRMWKVVAVIVCLALLTVIVGLAIELTTFGDCAWTAETRAWLDENGNGLWDANEPPLPYVPFWVDDIRNDYDKVGGATSNTEGTAQVYVWMPGCPHVAFEVYADAPQGYHATTQERWPAKGKANEGPFLFGFAYLPGQ